jgi:hypothetical protein
MKRQIEKDNQLGELSLIPHSIRSQVFHCEPCSQVCLECSAAAKTRAMNSSYICSMQKRRLPQTSDHVPHRNWIQTPNSRSKPHYADPKQNWDPYVNQSHNSWIANPIPRAQFDKSKRQASPHTPNSSSKHRQDKIYKWHLFALKLCRQRTCTKTFVPQDVSPADILGLKHKDSEQVRFSF